MCSGSPWFEKSLQIRYLTFTALLPLLVVCMAFFSLSSDAPTSNSINTCLCSWFGSLRTSSFERPERSLSLPPSNRLICHLEPWFHISQSLQESNTEPETHRFHQHFTSLFLLLNILNNISLAGLMK